MSFRQWSDFYVLTVRVNYERVALEGKSPSDSTNTENYATNQSNPVTAILDGRFKRYSTAALPIQLYHPAFATFIALRDDRSKDADIPEEILVKTALLLSGLSEVESQESGRNIDVRYTLSEILDVSLVGIVNSDSSRADFIHQVRTPKLGPVAHAAPVMAEIKPELGGNTDPTVQVSFSYRRYYSLPEVQLIAFSSLSSNSSRSYSAKGCSKEFVLSYLRHRSRWALVNNHGSCVWYASDCPAH